MLEYWNVGILVSGKMEHRVNGKNLLDKEVYKVNK